jgi:hypothetical protein
MKHSMMFAVVVLVAQTIFTSFAFAANLVFTQEFPGGFDVSINGGTFTPSGPITVTGILDDTTADIYGGSHHAEYPLSSVTFTGAGFVNRAVATPLSLCIFNTFGPQNFGFQRLRENNEGIIGWNGSSSSGNFMSNIHNLSTLVALPYTTSGTSTFWWNALKENAWTLDMGGDTIGANLGSSGPAGIFSIGSVPEPSTIALLGMGAFGLLAWAWRRRK